MVAAGAIALMKQPQRKLAAGLAISSLSFSLLLSLIAFAHALSGWAHGAVVREIFNFTWFRFGTTHVELGWVLDPLAAIMLVMVSFVGLLIFIYSTGYMEHDENFTRFFCFLSLFAGAMLGVVISNSILLLFMCWEIVGLTSYLLIGFWYQKPSAAAAAKKAFITTRFGDVFFFLGNRLALLRKPARCFFTTTAWVRLKGWHSPICLRCTCGARLERRRSYRIAHLRRRSGQERPVSTARVAARRDGRSHAGLRADSRGDHGCRGRLSGCARFIRSCRLALALPAEPRRR